ncbi:MAG: hypothetical protein M1836_003370 [Candelina mexicana]|nr:MAG: hypothetical protein M1836_003370 [Candelina mexicana]
MKLLLIRHGETVDNIAQLYAGVRDSALTNHGVIQANRLGQYLAATGLKFTEIYSSDLQRAFKTAEAIRLAQIVNEAAREPLELRTVQLPILREQDFGFYEGKPFYARSPLSKKNGKDTHYDQHKDDPGFQDVESKEAMIIRMDSFLGEKLVPKIKSEKPAAEHIIAIVSHGIILSTLWRCLLRRFAPSTVSLKPGLFVGRIALEHLGVWSNTGYLELDIKRKSEAVKQPTGAGSDKVTTSSEAPSDASTLLTGWITTIQTVNGKEHLTGVKRTRGGVGSSKYDEGQKTIDTFFKKTKLDQH